MNITLINQDVVIYYWAVSHTKYTNTPKSFSTHSTKNVV